MGVGGKRLSSDDPAEARIPWSWDGRTTKRMKQIGRKELIKRAGQPIVSSVLIKQEVRNGRKN